MNVSKFASPSQIKISLTKQYKFKQYEIFAELKAFVVVVMHVNKKDIQYM